MYQESDDPDNSPRPYPEGSSISWWDVVVQCLRVSSPSLQAAYGGRTCRMTTPGRSERRTRTWPANTNIACRSNRIQGKHGHQILIAWLSGGNHWSTFDAQILTFYSILTYLFSLLCSILWSIEQRSSELATRGPWLSGMLHHSRVWCSFSIHVFTTSRSPASRVAG